MIRYRLTQTPTRPLPLNVRSAGHYRLGAGESYVREPGGFLQLFWSVAGGGCMMLAKRSVNVPAGSLIHYVAGEPHTLVAGSAGWEYRWFTLDGAGSAKVIEAWRLRRVQPAPPCPADLFERLDDALRDPTPAGEARASLLAYELLLRATEPPSTTPTTGDAEAARAWLDAHYADAHLNVSTLAARFGLHRSSLHRQFMRSHGVAPVQYLGRLRLRRGLELLGTSRLPVADVAVRCGLPDVAYFSKLVSRHTGYSPREYRRRSDQGAGVTSTGAAASASMSQGRRKTRVPSALLK